MTGFEPAKRFDWPRSAKRNGNPASNASHSPKPEAIQSSRPFSLRGKPFTSSDRYVLSPCKQPLSCRSLSLRSCKCSLHCDRKVLCSCKMCLFACKSELHERSDGLSCCRVPLSSCRDGLRSGRGILHSYRRRLSSYRIILYDDKMVLYDDRNALSSPMDILSFRRMNLSSRRSELWRRSRFNRVWSETQQG